MDDEKLLAFLQTLEDEKCERLLRIICPEPLHFTAVDLTHCQHGLGINKCAANLFDAAGNWDERLLNVKWNEESRVFTVEFTGKRSIDPKLAKFLSQSLPAYIAKSSTCQCGKALQLGNYQVTTTNDNFKFEGCYFCPNCTAKFTAKRRGILKRIAKWFSSVRKVQINTTGLDIELKSQTD